jgi:hypothetical protein
MQKNKIHMETSYPTEEIGDAQVPPQILNSMVQPLPADQSQTIAVESVGQSQSTVHQRHGKQRDQKQMEACLKQLNSTIIQESGKHLDVEGTEMCVIQPSSTTVQESLQSCFKDQKVCIRKSTAVQKYDRQSNVQETKVCFRQPNPNTVEDCGKHSNDMTVTLLDPSNAVPVTKKALSHSLTHCDTSVGHSSCDINRLSGSPLNAGETSALVSTTNYPIIHYLP